MKYLIFTIYFIGIMSISGCYPELPVINTSVKSTPSAVSAPFNDGTKEKKKGKKYAVVIGIDNYSNQNKIPELKKEENQLKHAVDDALAIASRLENMGFEVAKPLLLNERATEKNIFDQFRNLNMKYDDQLVIFYAGHGSIIKDEQKGYIHGVKDEQQGCIVSSDGVTIPFERFCKITYNLPPKHILYIFDSCHSGFLDPAVQLRWPVNGKKLRQSPRISGLPQLQEEQESKPAVYTLTAASSEELAREKNSEWSGHSFFTFHLLKGLDGAADVDDDCKITMNELGVYLTQVVEEQEQHPLFNRVVGEGEIAFTPPRCQENQKSTSEQQQLFLDQKICDTQDTQLFLDTTWETSDAYQGRTSDAYKGTPAYNQPTQLLLDKSNNLYVLDTDTENSESGMVHKFDAKGKYIRSYYPENHENWVPTSMALKNDSSLWVYYFSGKRGEILIYDGEKAPRRWGGEGDLLHKCVFPYGLPKKGLIALDAEDNIILVDQKTGILTKCMTNDGARWKKPREKEEDSSISEEENNDFETVTEPQGLAVDKFGYIYVTDTGGHGIQRYSFDREWIPGWINAQGDSPYFFNSPHAITVDANFHVYIADTNNDRIKKYSVDGKYLLACWGKQGNIDFDRPQGVAVGLDEEGRPVMYVADTGHKRVKRFFFSPK